MEHLDGQRLKHRIAGRALSISSELLTTRPQIPLLSSTSLLQNGPMSVELRPAVDHDFEYCRGLYFVEIRWIIEELNLDRTAQETGFRQQWNPAEVRIIVLDGTDVGWLQAMTQNDELFVAQMFVDGSFQRRGIGTEVVKLLIGEANGLNLAVRLNVVKINPAQRLYERLGFRVTGEDDRKFYMKRDPDKSPDS
jgi:ribosomal protein S18 acetylase RimI-like enzyme